MSPTALQWLSLVGVLWLQSINATNSNFPAYSSQLKHLLSISQLQLNNLAFASDAGKLFGWLAGIAAGHLPLWLVLLIGSLLGLLGYGVQYLFISNKISSLTYIHIFLLAVMAGNSICWINTVCYIITIRNFPTNTQTAVGLTTSYSGLSAKIYTDIVGSLFSSPTKRAKSYLLLNSILPIMVCVIASPLARDINVGKTKDVSGFVLMFVITIATGIYAVIGSLGSVSPSNNAIGIGVFLLAPLMIPLEVLMREKWRKKGERRVYGFSTDENISERIESGVKEEGGEREEGEVGVKEEIGVKLMVQRVEFWLYFFVYLFSVTLGLVFLNNLGQIAESRGYSNTSSLVALSSSFGFFGRLMPSLLDYFFSRGKYKISRFGSIVALVAPMAASFFLLLNKNHHSLCISTAIIGLCTGAITSISVSTTSDLFGTKNFSVNHNIVVANIPVGSFLYGYLAAAIYRKQGNDGDGGKCMGVECYRMTFIIWGSICFVGTCLSLILYCRMRKFYLQRS